MAKTSKNYVKRAMCKTTRHHLQLYSVVMERQRWRFPVREMKISDRANKVLKIFIFTVKLPRMRGSKVVGLPLIIKNISTS